MGRIAKGTPTVDKLLDVIVEQQKNQQDFTREMIQLMKTQQQMMQGFVMQYVPTGTNSATTLDDRLYEKELSMEAPEWEAMPNPFDGM